MKLHEKAIVINYKVSCYGGVTEDKKQASKLAETYNKTLDEAAIQVKNNILGNPPELKDLKKFASHIRGVIKSMGVIPYTDGSVIIPKMELGRFKNICQELTEQYKHKLKAFEYAFPDIVENAKRSKGELLSEDQIPTWEWVEKRFGFTTMAAPIPDVNNFDALLDADGDIEELKEEFSQELQDLSKRYNEELKNQLLDRLRALEKNITVCTKGLNPKVFRTTEEVIKKVENNNILEDVSVNVLIREIRKIISQPLEVFADEAVKLATINKIRSLV